MTVEPCKADGIKQLIYFPQPITSHRGSGKLSRQGRPALGEYLSNQGHREKAIRTQVLTHWS